MGGLPIPPRTAQNVTGDDLMAGLKKGAAFVWNGVKTGANYLADKAVAVASVVGDGIVYAADGLQHGCGGCSGEAEGRVPGPGRWIRVRSSARVTLEATQARATGKNAVPADDARRKDCGDLRVRLERCPAESGSRCRRHRSDKAAALTASTCRAAEIEVAASIQLRLTRRRTSARRSEPLLRRS